MDVAQLRKAVDLKTGERSFIAQELAKEQARNGEVLLNARCCEEAQMIIQQVAQLTQQKLEFHIGGLVSLALSAVFDDPYQFSVSFVSRNRRTECDLNFLRDGHIVDPYEDSGGGAVEVASFALRIALWSMAKPRSRQTLILDEPLKFLKGDPLPERGAQMIQEISKKLGVQIIMVSHIPDQIEGADRRISVKLVEKMSYVKVSA